MDSRRKRTRKKHRGESLSSKRYTQGRSVGYGYRVSGPRFPVKTYRINGPPPF